MTSKTTQTTKRQTQKGVARASAARKQTDAQAAKVRNITTARKAAQQTVETAIKDVLTGKTTDAAARKQIDAAVQSVTLPYICPRAGCEFAAAKSRERCPEHDVRVVRDRRDPTSPSYRADIAAAQASEAKKAAAKKAATSESTIKSQDETRSAKDLAETLRGEAQKHVMKITIAAERLQSAERQLAEKEIDARNPATVDSYKVHRDRDAAIQELIELGAGWTYIARVRGVASSTNRGLCRVIMGGKRI
jgi:hypothetical protein